MRACETIHLEVSPMREILRTLTDSIKSGRDVVACSLVETRGSTPQKAGAWMLVFPDASQCGTLGGGCVEAEVKQHALRLLDGGGAELLTFSLDDNYGWDDGLICGGRMQVLAEPLRGGDGDDVGYFETFRTLIESGDGCTEAVVIDSERVPNVPAGARVLFCSTGEIAGQRRIAAVPATITQHLPNLPDRPRPATRDGVAYMPLLPRCRLVIVGAGHVGQAVAELAAQSDFDVWVIDDRDRYANKDRFPRAERLIVGDIGQVLPNLETDSRTFCIIVTRGHSHDEEALYHLAGKPSAYLGMIGSKRKIRLIFDDLLAAGIPQSSLDRVHAPLGIDIGSQTVPEIAISIIAELIAVRNLGHSSDRLSKSGVRVQESGVTHRKAEACTVDAKNRAVLSPCTTIAERGTLTSDS
jgi:xanthine dehydrogenase accessory factor